MKRLFAPALILVVLALSGCESAPGEVHGRLGPPPATSRMFQADLRAVYDAALVSLAHMEFRVIRGGPAQGKIEAVSGLSTNDSLTSTRQISISIRITPAGSDGTEVSADLKEAIEEDSQNRQGFATETKLRDTPYYDVFFNGLAQALNAPQKD